MECFQQKPAAHRFLEIHLRTLAYVFWFSGVACPRDGERPGAEPARGIGSHRERGLLYLFADALLDIFGKRTCCRHDRKRTCGKQARRSGQQLDTVTGLTLNVAGLHTAPMMRQVRSVLTEP